MKHNPNRRKIITAMASAPIALATPAIAQTKIKWRMVTSWAENLPGPGVTAKRLADSITNMSGGRLEVQLYAANKIVPPLEVFDAVQNKTAQMAHTAPLFWGGKIPAAPLFTAAPFGLTPTEHITWINHGGGQEIWDKLYEPFGIKPFMAGNTGSQMGGWFKKQIFGVDDLKGLRIRMPGLGGEVMRRLGAAPITLPPNEILTALQSGVIDATEFLGPAADFAMGFYRVAKYYYSPGWHEPNGTAEALVSINELNKLPDDLKEIVKHACHAQNIFGLAESEWQNAAQLKILTEEKNVMLKDYPEDIINQAKKETIVVMDELSLKNVESGEAVKSWRNAKKHLNEWSEVSIQKFLQKRK